MKYKILLFLAIVTTFLNCSKSTSLPARDNYNETKIKKYLALGDSYTIGESVAIDQRFPVQLAHIKFKNVDSISVKIIAKTGWTTRNLLDAIAVEKSSLETQYDLITLLIGVNNQYQGKPIQQYKDELKTLFDEALKMVGGKSSKLIVVSIPDYGVTPFAAKRNPTKISEEIDLYNSINKEFADKYGAQYVNITDISKQAATNPQLLAADLLHPSGEMYRLWTERIAKKVAVIF
jgi:lysophospholipase L1-like esterase